MKQAECRILLRGGFTMFWTSPLQFPCFCLLFGALSFFIFCPEILLQSVGEMGCSGYTLLWCKWPFCRFIFFTFNFNMNSKRKGTKIVQVVHKSVTKFTNFLYMILPFYTIILSACMYMHTYAYVFWSLLKCFSARIRQRKIIVFFFVIHK